MDELTAFQDLYDPLSSHRDFAESVNDSDLPITLGVVEDDYGAVTGLTIEDNESAHTDTELQRVMTSLAQSRIRHD